METWSIPWLPLSGTGGDRCSWRKFGVEFIKQEADIVSALDEVHHKKMEQKLFKPPTDVFFRKLQDISNITVDVPLF